jgi:ArsR family transcriptional regulator
MSSEAKIFKALADETRLKILLLLMNGELCVCEIIAALELPQSTVSRHLAYLRNSGWVSGRRQGNWMYYQLADTKHELIDALLPLLKQHIGATTWASEALANLDSFQKNQAQQNCSATKTY